MTFFHDQGAYVRTHAATVPDLAAAMLPGPYRVPAYRAVGHIRLTNKTPCGTYRAPGRFESTLVRERVLDAIAAQLEIDLVEVRRRNLIGASEMPFRRPLDTLGTEIVLTPAIMRGCSTRRSRRSSGMRCGSGWTRGVVRNLLVPVSLCLSRKAGLVHSIRCTSLSTPAAPSRS